MYTFVFKKEKRKRKREVEIKKKKRKKELVRQYLSLEKEIIVFPEVETIKLSETYCT